MFKYIKKLTSVVVMFAVIIVFSSSNVYAAEKKQTNNPFFLMFASMQITKLNTSTPLNELQDKFSKLKKKLNKIALGNNAYRSIQLKKINQKLNQDGDGGDGGGGGGDGH